MEGYRPANDLGVLICSVLSINTKNRKPAKHAHSGETGRGEAGFDNAKMLFYLSIRNRQYFSGIYEAIHFEKNRHAQVYRSLLPFLLDLSVRQ
jgi:hypothetical protein